MVAQQHQQTGAAVRRYDYEDRTVLAIDLGPGATPEVDVVGDTAIVVTPDGRQEEFTLPEGDVEAFNHNGVVSIEVTK